MNLIKKFWKKYKTPFVIILAIGLIFAMFYYVLVPLKRLINEKADRIQEISIDQEVDTSRIARLTEFSRQFGLINFNYNRIDLFVSEDRIVNLLRQIELLAEETGNEIEINIIDKEKTIQKKLQINKAKEKAKENIKNQKDVGVVAPQTIIENLPHDNYLEMEIMIRGDFNQALEFIQKLNGLDYLSDITQINIVKQKNDKLESNRGSAILPISATDGEESVQREEIDIEKIRASKELSSLVNIIFYLSK